MHDSSKVLTRGLNSIWICCIHGLGVIVDALECATLT